MNILQQLNTIDIATIVIYFVAMILIGVQAGKKVKSSSDFTSAGQKLSWRAVAGSTIATCMGANMVMGKYDLIFESGMAGLTASLFWWVGWIFLIIMAKKLRESKATSIPSYLEEKYNKTTRKICSLCVLIAMVSSCAAQFLTIGTIFETFGVCDRKTGTWIGAAIIVVFTILSGLWGVTMTDSIQSIILLIAFGVVFPVVVFKVAGGWTAVVEFNGPERMNMFSGIAPITMVGWGVYYTLSTGAEPSYSQRIFASKSTKDAVIGQVVAWVATLIVCGFVSAVPGLAIGKIFPDIVAGNQFTPVFIVTYLPAVIRGLMLAALLGLMLTSGDSYLLLLASTVMDDIISPIKKDMEDNRKILYTRLICVISAIVITAMALYVNSIYQLFKTGGGAYGAGVFIPLFLACFWKRANEKAINIGMITGFAVSFCFDMFLKIPMGLNLDGCTIGAVICLVICFAGSLILSEKRKAVG